MATKSNKHYSYTNTFRYLAFVIKSIKVFNIYCPVSNFQCLNTVQIETSFIELRFETELISVQTAYKRKNKRII